MHLRSIVKGYFEKLAKNSYLCTAFYTKTRQAPPPKGEETCPFANLRDAVR